MAIVGSVFALVGRFAGRLLNSALGWATILLFGKVDGRKQSVLLVIALGSLLWVLAIVGMIFPDVGTFMLAFVPVPDFIDEGVVRLAMLGAAGLIPLLIGAAAIAIADPATRPRQLGLVGGVLRGYPFTVVLAVTIVILAVVSLVRKLRSLAKRWDDAHIPLVVKPGAYDAVLEDIEGVLDRSGLEVWPGPAPRVLSIPPRLLRRLSGSRTTSGPWPHPRAEDRQPATRRSADGSARSMADSRGSRCRSTNGKPCIASGSRSSATRSFASSTLFPRSPPTWMNLATGRSQSNGPSPPPGWRCSQSTSLLCSSRALRPAGDAHEAPIASLHP